MDYNTEKFINACKSTIVFMSMLDYDCKATLNMLYGTSTIKCSLDDETYMKSRLNDIRTGIGIVKRHADSLLAAIDDNEEAIINEYKKVRGGELRDQLEKDGCEDLAKDGYDKEMIKKLESELCNKYHEVYESSRNSQVPRNRNLLSCYELRD